MNDFYIKNENELTINFKDGTVYEIIKPNSKISGIIKGNKTFYYTGEFYIYDKKNNLKLFFTEIKKETKNFVTNWWNKKKEEDKKEFIPNSYEIKLIKVNENSEDIIENGKGSYTRYFEMENKIYWNINDKFEYWKLEQDNIMLPSSSLKRKEINLIKEKKFDEAEKILMQIDNDETYFNKLRKINK